MSLAIALVLLMSGPVGDEGESASVVHADGVTVTVPAGHRIRVFPGNQSSKRVQLTVDRDGGRCVVNIEAEQLRVESEDTVTELRMGDNGQMVVKSSQRVKKTAAADSK